MRAKKCNDSDDDDDNNNDTIRRRDCSKNGYKRYESCEIFKCRPNVHCCSSDRLLLQGREIIMTQ